MGVKVYYALMIETFVGKKAEINSKALNTKTTELPSKTIKDLICQDRTRVLTSDTKKKSIWPKKCYAQKYSNIALASSYVKIHEKTFSVKYKIQINFSIWTLRCVSREYS